MKIFDIDKKQYNNQPRNIALGNFDGFHKGHQQIISKMIKETSNKIEETSILLFKDHTLRDLDQNIDVLTTLDQKIEVAKTLGVDSVFVVSFDKLRNLTSEQFLDMLRIKLGVKGIYVGDDYRFGIQGTGNIDTLRQYTDENDMELNVLELITDNDTVISSTVIRELIRSSKLSEAERLLGSKYYIQGKVVKGKQLGSKLGFPTANINLIDNYVLPSPGVYHAQIIINDVTYNSATSVGKNKTFENELEDKIESHILNFDEDIYGCYVKLRFISKIRGMIKFSGIEELKNQVLSDIKTISELGDKYESEKD